MIGTLQLVLFKHTLLLLVALDLTKEEAPLDQEESHQKQKIENRTRILAQISRGYNVVGELVDIRSYDKSQSL